MSNQSIPELTELTSTASDDELIIVDKSDTTDGTSGTNKKITTTNLLSTTIPTSYLDTDGTLAANSDVKISSQKATKTYADTKIAKSVGTAQGDIIYFTASATPARLAKGTANQVLTMNSGATAPEWATANTGVKYAADAGSNDTYAITVSPAPSIYNVGDMYLFRANTANTGAATLNVNSLGAITIKKKGATDLADNDILANNMVLVAYNSFQTTGTTVDSYSESNQSNVDDIYTGSRPSGGQSFTCSTSAVLTSCKFYLKKTGSPTGNMYAKLYAHSGTYGTSSIPTGAALAISDAIDISTLTTSLALTTFTFSGVNQYSMSAGTYYVIVVEYNGGNASNRLNPGLDDTATAHSGNYSRTADLSSWSAVNTVDYIFYVYGTTTTTRFEMLSQIAN